MGELIDAYDHALKTEDENPVAAMSIYMRDLININPTTSKDYQETLIVKYLFLIGYVGGLLFDIYYFRGESITRTIIILIFAPLIQGILVMILFRGLVSMIVNVDKPPSSEKYWVAMLGYIGAARCAIMIGQPEKGEGYAAGLTNFGFTITDHLSDGLIALSEHDYTKAGNSLSLAAHDIPPGKYHEHLKDAIYRCIKLHPHQDMIIKGGLAYRRDPADQHMHSDPVDVQTNIQDSVINRSEIRNTKRGNGKRRIRSLADDLDE